MIINLCIYIYIYTLFLFSVHVLQLVKQIEFKNYVYRKIRFAQHAMCIIRDYSCGPHKLRVISCRRQVGVTIIIYKSRRNQIALGKCQDDGRTAVKEFSERG